MTLNAKIGGFMDFLAISGCDTSLYHSQGGVTPVPMYTGWSKKLHKVYDTIILQPYITESCGFQQNVLKEILYMTKVSV